MCAVGTNTTFNYVKMTYWYYLPAMEKKNLLLNLLKEKNFGINGSILDSIYGSISISKQTFWLWFKIKILICCTDSCSIIIRLVQTCGNGMTS